MSKDLKNIAGIYLILDRELAGERSYAEILEQCIPEGVKIVQLREKRLSAREFIKLALEVKEICRKLGALLIINDRTDIAFACDADGVHLGQDDLPVEYARKILGKEKIIGISAGNEKELDYALKQDVDYISPGAVFGSKTKTDAGSPVGTGFVKKVLSATDKPVIPIGGINLENIDKLTSIGINKVAVISALLKAQNLQEYTRAMYRKLSNATKLKDGAQG